MKKLTTILFAIMLAVTTYAQVAINSNGNIANSSAMLDVASTSKGMLIPRLTLTQRNNISDPATGLLVFVTSQSTFYYYNGTEWEEIGKGASGWELQNYVISTDSLHKVVIGNDAGNGVFQVITDESTGTYTSNKCTSGTPSAQESAPGKPASNAFDDNSSTYWSNDGNLSVWLQYKLADGKVIAKYRIYFEGGGYDSSPKDWSFQASDDGSSWTTLDTRTNENWDSNGWKEYTFSNEARYTYYRILITDNKGTTDNYVYINELEMQELIYSNHPTLYVDDNKVGIGTSSPQATLHVDGSLRIVDGNEASGKVLTSDSTGNTTWQLPSIDQLSDGIATGNNIYLGDSAGMNAPFSERNLSIGIKSLYGTNSFRNVAVGHYSLSNSSTGYYNVAVGNYSMNSNSEGIENTAVGDATLNKNTLGSYNVSIGSLSLLRNTTGTNNVAIGYLTGAQNRTGSNNVMIGYQTGGADEEVKNNTGCVFIGAYAGYFETGNNKLYIDNIATSNPLIGGDFVTDEVYINGTIKITGGSPGTNKLLTSDADGNATWGFTSIDALSDAENGASFLFMGTNAGENNIEGYNFGIGRDALRQNTIGSHNTALGYKSLDANIGGCNNTAVGLSSIGGNTSGEGNTAMGKDVLLNNTTGNYNTAVGLNSIGGNTSGEGNTAMGKDALLNNTTGNYNTALGLNAFNTTSTYSNSTAIGYNTPIDGNNQVHLGNTSITEIKGQVDFTKYSDGRIKENIKENVVGLDFITKLRPVTYNINLDKENQLLGITDNADFEGKYDITKIRMTGFIAQEVEESMKKCNYDFSGVNIPDGPNDLYGLTYSEFVVPLVKAMQEQQQMIKDQQHQIDKQKQLFNKQDSTIYILIKKIELLEKLKK